MTFWTVQAQRGADLDHLSKNDPAGSAGLTEKLIPNVAELRDSLFIPAKTCFSAFVFSWMLDAHFFDLHAL